MKRGLKIWNPSENFQPTPQSNLEMGNGEYINNCCTVWSLPACLCISELEDFLTDLMHHACFWSHQCKWLTDAWPHDTEPTWRQEVSCWTHSCECGGQQHADRGHSRLLITPLSFIRDQESLRRTLPSPSSSTEAWWPAAPPSGLAAAELWTGNWCNVLKTAEDHHGLSSIHLWLCTQMFSN